MTYLSLFALPARSSWRLLTLYLLGFGVLCAAEPPPVLAPDGWGSDHVGQPFPDYITGEECLFCHRKIGASWGENRHTQTIRPIEPQSAVLQRLPPKLAGEVSHVMGDDRMTRFLRRSSAYGKLEMLAEKFPAEKSADSALSRKAPSTSEAVVHANWDAKTFNDQCAGCHTTAVDSETRSFSAIAIDCVACHGVVELAHTKDPSRVLLSAKKQSPRQIASICGQCHLRDGKSKSSSLPYPNTFVPRDNLFRDFQVDLSTKSIAQRDPVNRHVFENVRNVAILGKTSQSCLSCHDVHADSTNKHQALESSAACHTCHVPGTDHAELKPSFLQSTSPHGHSRVCGY